MENTNRKTQHIKGKESKILSPKVILYFIPYFKEIGKGYNRKRKKS